MPDFIYKHNSENLKIQKFDNTYTHKIVLSNSINIYHNINTLYCLQTINSVYILGYAYTIGENINSYFSKILTNFTEEQIPIIKKKVLGQYIIIIEKDNTYYIFSDFLQSRNIFYNTEEQSISSSFSTLHNLDHNKNINEYKIFEYLSMRHCLYPVWLGNTTINNNVKRLRAYEYIKANPKRNSIEISDIKFHINNTKTENLKLLTQETLSVFRNVVQHPEYRYKSVHTTITGGFDSRLITSLVNEYYPNIHLRIASVKGKHSLDFDIAQKVAKKLSIPLLKHETLTNQTNTFYNLTDGLMPTENMIMTQLLLNTNSSYLGFGGAYGTELFSILKDNKIKLITDYICITKAKVKADESYYIRFKEALENELNEIHNHYILNHQEEKDHIRIFQILVTGFFSSSIIAAYNIKGKQFEPFGTFPIIESALKIPYKYIGGKKTIGKFYLIPKRLAEHTNLPLSKIITTHFCPMRPLSTKTFIPYVIGRIKKSIHRKQIHAASTPISTLEINKEKFQYSSTDWFKGFIKNYL